MKHFLNFIILIIATNNCFAQETPVSDSLINIIKTIQTDIVFDLNYRTLKKYYRILEKDTCNEKDTATILEGQDLLDVFFHTTGLVKCLYEIESTNYNKDELLNKSCKIINSFSDLKFLSVLLTVIRSGSFVGETHKQSIQNKLIRFISNQMQTIASNELPLYNYPTIVKKRFKGIQIEHVNDLQAPFKKNNDMDYTGGLRVSIVTDMLKLDLFKPTQSYQVITYGGDVYTPYFKDTSLFVKDDTFNVFDRPHGCFQFIGLENHAISEHYKVRWSTNLRIGIIGGRFGYNFQYYLHRDLSVSPAPVGWDAQIGYPGRLAIQGDFRLEHLLYTQHYKIKNRNYKVVLSSILGGGIGHFMTYGDIGINLSTHNFKEKNQMSIISKSFQTSKTEIIRKAVPYTDINIIFRGVVHNAMLDGFGLAVSNEKKDSKKGFAEPSLYVLEQERVKPLVVFSNLTLGIQLSNFNLFYRYSIKSPEYRSSGKLNALNKKGEKIDPNTSWHHYASIGLAFTP